MVIHHLNCGTLRPPSQRLVNGHGRLFGAATMVCHCLLVETENGWTLIDTGLGTRDVARPMPAHVRGWFATLTRPLLDVSETALAQVVALGIDPEAVTDVVLTHLDVDHAGGILDFPWARIHVSATQHALARPGVAPSVRWRLHPAQWAGPVRWAPAELSGTYRGRPSARISDSVRLVDLPGHIAGHCGVLVDRPSEAPLLHGGDALFSTNTLSRRRAPVGLAAFERVMRTDRAGWAVSRAWLCARHDEGVEVIAAHEPFGA